MQATGDEARESTERLQGSPPATKIPVQPKTEVREPSKITQLPKRRSTQPTIRLILHDTCAYDEEEEEEVHQEGERGYKISLVGSLSSHLQ